MQVIENQEELLSLCQKLNQQKFITVDSEFVREKTYFSELCLLQVGWVDDAAIIDPLANGINLAPFFEVMQNENVLKVFHSGRQDIEIFYNLSGKIPHPVFDTQIAAMACGFGASVSYGSLVAAVTNVELDKSSRLTDWKKRPLDTKQLEYALRDVTYLIQCYLYLEKYLKEHGREDWIKEETAALCDENLYKPDPENAWLKIRHSAHSAQFLAVLKALASWRELRAVKYNSPRNTIMKDDMLVNIAAVAPKNTEELFKVRNLPQDVAKGKLGHEVVDAVNAALGMPFTSELQKIDRARQVHIPPAVSALTEVLKLLLKIKSEQEGVVASLIASEQDLRDIACGNNDKTNPALSGWRYEIFGKTALLFRKGKAVIRYDVGLKDIAVDEI